MNMNSQHKLQMLTHPSHQVLINCKMKIKVMLDLMGADQANAIGKIPIKRYDMKRLENDDVVRPCTWQRAQGLFFRITFFLSTLILPSYAD